MVDEDGIEPSGKMTATELAELVRANADGLAGAVRGVLGPTADAEEVLQEVFLKAWRALRREPTPPSDPVAWLFVVTMNLAKDHGRAARRRASAALDDIAETDMQTTGTRVDPPSAAEHSEALAAARAAIHERLDDAEREVFLLRASGGLTFEAAAAALAIPIGTAKTRMRSALRKLRAHLAAFAPTATVTDPSFDSTTRSPHPDGGHHA